MSQGLPVIYHRKIEKRKGPFCWDTGRVFQGHLGAIFSQAPCRWKKDGFVPCTAVIVAGFQSLPSWRALAYQNSLSRSYVQIVDSSDLVGVPLGKRNHPDQTFVFPDFFPLKMDKCQRWCKKQALTLAPYHGRLAVFVDSIHVPLSQPKMRLEHCSLSSACYSKIICSQLSTKLQVGYYTPLNWPSQMCASQSCPLTMPLTGGFKVRFGGLNLTPFYR